MIVILMGVSGSGKTTVGRLLADRLDYEFLDADDHHPPQNREKMTKGIPLSDEDRLPWLETLRKLIEEHRHQNRSMVLACSALKSIYREKLGIGQPDVRLVYLKASREELERRLKERKDHFFPSDLLNTQIETLEEPTAALIIDTDQTSIAEIVNRIVAGLQLPPGN